MSGHIIAAKERVCNPSGSEKRASGDCEAAVKAESVLNAVLGKAIINEKPNPPAMLGRME